MKTDDKGSAAMIHVVYSFREFYESYAIYYGNY